MRSPTTIGAEAPAGTGVMNMIPALSARLPVQPRDHLVGGLAPGKRPLPSPRHSVGRSALGIWPWVPSGAFARALLAAVSAAVAAAAALLWTAATSPATRSARPTTPGPVLKRALVMARFLEVGWR